MTYQPNIPLATDLISVSQGDIKNNFQAIGTAFDVNHIDFNASGAGKHKFAEFPNQSSNPATAAAETTLFAKAVSGLSRLFIREESSGTVLQFSGPVTATSAGSTTLLGGIVLKWGDCGTVGTVGTAVAFGTAFPTACFQVVVTVYQNGSNSTRLVTVDGATLATTGFTAYSSANVNARYIAIGN